MYLKKRRKYVYREMMGSTRECRIERMLNRRTGRMELEIKENYVLYEKGRDRENRWNKIVCF